MRHTLHAAERAAIGACRTLGDLLDRHPVPFVLQSLARAIEHRGLPDAVSNDIELGETLPGRIAEAVRQLADHVDALQDARRFA